MGWERRNAKVDGNHNSIVKELEKLPGVSVKSVATIKKFLDIVVGYNGMNYLFEIKNPEYPPSARKLTPDEKEFHDNWQGQADVILFTQDILEKINYKHSK